MDLYAYTQIVDLGKIADRNGISVPRCRGYRLMKTEQRVTAAELEQMIKEQALYEAEKLFRLHASGRFYEYSERAKARARRYIVIQKNDNGFDEPVAVRWDKIHGKRRKTNYEKSTPPEGLKRKKLAKGLGLWQERTVLGEDGMDNET